MNRPLDSIPYALAVLPEAPRARSLTAIAADLAAFAREITAHPVLAYGVGAEAAEAIHDVGAELASMQYSYDDASASALDKLCAHCGHDQGDHMTEAPHACGHEYGNPGADSDRTCLCEAYVPPGAFAAPPIRDTERPPANDAPVIIACDAADIGGGRSHLT